MKILSSITLEPNGKKLEINNNSELAELTTMWKLNNTLLNTQWVQVKEKREIREGHTIETYQR